MVLPFATEMTARESIQLSANQREKTVQRCAIALPPAGQHSGDVACLRLHSSIYQKLFLHTVVSRVGKCRFQ